MTERHLSDDRLIDICVSSAAAPGEQAHLAACTTCEARRLSIVEILAELDTAAAHDADAAFPPDRLARQQTRILQRVDQDGRPGRLIAFPATEPAAAFSLRSRSHGRWAAAAAAAAFVIGLLAGHLVHVVSLGSQSRPTEIVANETDVAPLRAVSTTFSEDEFLGQIEVAASQNGPVALRPLDAMTPRAWDVR